MPDTLNVQVTASLFGRSYNEDQSTTGDNPGGGSPTVTAAKNGTLTTRTDDDTGEITGAASHGVNTGDKLDIYWDGGSRRNMTVGTVAGLAIPIDGGSGDVLPDDETVLTMKVPQEEGAMAIAGANVVGIVVRSPSYRGTVVIRQSGGTEIAAFVLAAGGSYIWTDQSGITNPVTGATIGKISFSHDDDENSQEMTCHLLYN